MYKKLVCISTQYTKKLQKYVLLTISSVSCLWSSFRSCTVCSSLQILKKKLINIFSFGYGKNLFKNYKKVTSKKGCKSYLRNIF